MLVPLLLISCLSTSGFASGFTNLQASSEFACMGENVTFSCATSHQFIIWEVTFTDPTIGPRMQIFRSSNDPKSFIESVYDQQLHFQLISTANGVIESILVVQASTLMENATIQCEGSEIRRLTFRLASAPGIPTGVALNNEIYYANVTLTWDEPGGRVDKYNVNVLTIGQTTLNFSMTESRSRLTLDEIPYNQDITVTVSAVNCVAESEKVNILFVIGGCNLTLSLPLNGIMYNSSLTGISNGIVASGEQVWFGCEQGFYPSNPMVATCQEDGLWHPDPSEVDCRRECLLPMNLSNLELTRRYSGDNASSLTIVLRCRDGFSPTNDQMPLAVCSHNGTWMPDLEEFECHNLTSVVPNIIINASRNNTNHLIYIITGSAVGCATLLVACSLFVAAVICITLCSKKSTILSQDRPDLELPVYEYITGPVYEHLDPSVTSIMTENEAYNTCCKEIRDYDIVQM